MKRTEIVRHTETTPTDAGGSTLTISFQVTHAAHAMALETLADAIVIPMVMIAAVIPNYNPLPFAAILPAGPNHC